MFKGAPKNSDIEDVLTRLSINASTYLVIAALMKNNSLVIEAIEKTDYKAEAGQEKAMSRILVSAGEKGMVLVRVTSPNGVDEVSLSGVVTKKTKGTTAILPITDEVLFKILDAAQVAQDYQRSKSQKCWKRDTKMKPTTWFPS
jgi:hypothetical protein